MGEKNHCARQQNWRRRSRLCCGTWPDRFINNFIVFSPPLWMQWGGFEDILSLWIYIAFVDTLGFHVIYNVHQGTQLERAHWIPGSISWFQLKRHASILAISVGSLNYVGAVVFNKLADFWAAKLSNQLLDGWEKEKEEEGKYTTGNYIVSQSKPDMDVVGFDNLSRQPIVYLFLPTIS